MRKTTSLLTFPKPLAIVSYPGEKGYDTIPEDTEGILPFYWQDDQGQDSHKVWREVDKVLSELRVGKYGPIQTLACDGLHKFADYIMDSITDGAFFGAEDFERRLWARLQRAVFAHIQALSETSIPIVAFTSWAELEKDRPIRPGERESDVPSHILPALPGALAWKIMGEFSVIVHQSIRRLPNDKPDVPPYAVWQTRAEGNVRGATLKGPPDIVKRIPTYIKAEYPELERHWAEAEKGGTG